MSLANSAVPGATASAVARDSSSTRFAIADDPPFPPFFGFFCSHLSRNDARVMSASGSPEYSTLAPNNNERAIAATEGCTLRSNAASSHQHVASARAYSGSRLEKS